MADAIEGRLVTMTSYVANPDGSLATHQATDGVAVVDIDSYVVDAFRRWQSVVVGDDVLWIDPENYTSPAGEPEPTPEPEPEGA